jgi:hypothetical protein
MGLAVGLRWTAKTDVDVVLGEVSLRTCDAAYGFSVFLGSDNEDELAAEVASLVQDAIIEQLHSGWPTCPVHHRHPLWADINDSGVAAWLCPTDEAQVEIGRLTAT